GIEDRHAAHAVIGHESSHVAHRSIGTNGEDILGHQASYFHLLPPLALSCGLRRSGKSTGLRGFADPRWDEGTIPSGPTVQGGGTLTPIEKPLRVRIRRPGGYDRLEIEHFDPGAPGPGEALIEVRAAGVNYADSTIRMGLYSSAKKYVGWPITPGFEFAGVVSALGEDVSTGRASPSRRMQPPIRVGDEVFGVTRFGGWSSHLVVDRSLILPLPKDLSLEQAAGFPTVFLTAYYPLFVLTRLRPGETVLIHSAAGGVGGALIQLCRVVGCRIVGVVGSAHKREVAAALGADAVIDKSTQDLWREAERAAPDGFSMILDANGA